MRRVFDVDALACPKCLTPMLVLAFITDPTALRRILEHLGLPTSPTPVSPARLPIEEEVLFTDDQLNEQPGDLADDEAPASAMIRRLPPAAS